MGPCIQKRAGNWDLEIKCTTTIQINTRTNFLNDCFEDVEIF